MEEKDIKVTGEMDINSDSDVPGTTHLKDPVEGKTDSEMLETELAETRDKYLRLVAEFDNFRKRTSKEKLELIQLPRKKGTKQQETYCSSKRIFYDIVKSAFQELR